MTNFVSVEKMSKKEKKAYYASQRSTWGTVKPVGIRFGDSKKFNKAGRARDKAALRCGL